MNSFEIIPTEENLIQALHDDMLKRNKDLVYFYELLLSQEVSSSIAIDGRWGSGKTFFVKQSMLLINAKNRMSGMEDEKRTDILQSLQFPNKEDGIPENYELAVYYDAWENDNDTDPVLSLVYEIVKEAGCHYVFSDKSNVFKLAGSILETFTDKKINHIIDNLKSESPLTKIKEQKNLHDNIKRFFTEILVERANRLVIFVDELDRCSPSYAVKLLERIKHYLCDERITVVFAVNLEELQHTIKHFYGNTFDACRYLDRFFDMRISLPPVDKSAFYGQMGLDSRYVFDDVCRQVIKVYNMELREASRFYCQVKTAAYEPTHDRQKWGYSFSDDKGKQLLLVYIVPILVGLKIVNITLYTEFVNGKNVKPLMDIYKDSEEGYYLAERLLNKDEAFEELEGKKIVTVKQKLQGLYDAIFVKEYTNRDYHTMISNFEFDKHSKDFAEMVASLLSPYADFNI